MPVKRRGQGRKAIPLSLTQARRLVLRGQGLFPSWTLPDGKEGAAQVVERLGYVQIDTISVIQRAHEHILWTRHPSYAPPMLHDLLARDRRVFEYWTHAAAYVPMRDYRFYRARMKAAASTPWKMEWLEQNAAIVEDVRRRIRDEGPLPASAFTDPSGGKRGPWWDWTPAKRTLEVLFDAGELMVSERRNFQRVYDLTERVLPSDIDLTEPTTEERTRFGVRRALTASGIATPLEIKWGLKSLPGLPGVLDEMTHSGDIVPVRIEGLDEIPYYALADSLKNSDTSVEPPAVHLLSPFDNLVILRDRLRALFGFDYRIECYIPEQKREHGYFCLPILWGDRFVGRLDSKADRKSRTFILKRLIMEPGFVEYDALLPSLAEKLSAFMGFNGCGRIQVESIEPDTFRMALIRALDR